MAGFCRECGAEVPDARVIEGVESEGAKCIRHWPLDCARCGHWYFAHCIGAMGEGCCEDDCECISYHSPKQFRTSDQDLAQEPAHG